MCTLRTNYVQDRRTLKQVTGVNKSPIELDDDSIQGIFHLTNAHFGFTSFLAYFRNN